jgi:hypothetical protein
MPYSMPAQAGGQLSELYPKKPIYDIPGFQKYWLAI